MLPNDFYAKWNSTIKIKGLAPYKNPGIIFNGKNI